MLLIFVNQYSFFQLSMLTINSIRLPIVISVDVLDPEGDDKQNHDVPSC